MKILKILKLQIYKSKKKIRNKKKFAVKKNKLPFSKGHTILVLLKEFKKFVISFFATRSFSCTIFRKSKKN